MVHAKPLIGQSREKMLKQIVFIYRDEFVCRLMLKMTADAGINCYTLSDVNENFGYVLDDLSPELVVIDQVSLENHTALIEESLKASQAQFKTVLLKKSESETTGFDFQMNLPIKVETFIDEISSLVK